MSVLNPKPIDPVGIGIKYPIQFKDGKLALTASTYSDVSGSAGIGDEPTSTRRVLAATNAEKKVVIRQSVSRIVGTLKGSRFFNGDAGSFVDLMVYEENTPVAQTLAASYGNSAVQEQEPRVAVLAAVGGVDPDAAEKIKCQLDYRIRDTDIIGTVTYTVDGET